MRIGIPKEIKTQEYRVGMVPGGVAQLVRAGRQVLVERGAGLGSGFDDDAYFRAGATIVDTAAEAWAADMVVKVKEPVRSEYGYFRPDLTLYTYLHLAAEPELTRAMVASGMTGIAYETIQLEDGTLPLLTPMSEIAGRMAAQVGAFYLERVNGGRGVLLGGIPGVRPGRVVIIGGGVVGLNAAKIALGLGAETYILDVDLKRLAYLDDIFGNSRVQTVFSNPANVAELVSQADLVIGAVLITGAKAPRLVTREMVQHMPKGAVIVDVAIDQGGCIETARPTTHAAPTYIEEEVLHYCVTNMPGAVPRSSTLGLTNATLRYALKLADDPLKAMRKDPALRRGLNTYRGKLVYQAVAEAHGMEYSPLEGLL